jgi:hypothetical protein
MHDNRCCRPQLRESGGDAFGLIEHRRSLQLVPGAVSSFFPAPEIPPFRAGRRCGLSLVANVFGDDGKRGAAA